MTVRFGRDMCMLLAQGCRTVIAAMVLAIAAVLARAEPGNAPSSPQLSPQLETRGDAIVPPVKRMAPQMPANVAEPDEKLDAHKHKANKHKAKKKRH